MRSNNNTSNHCLLYVSVDMTLLTVVLLPFALFAFIRLVQKFIRTKCKKYMKHTFGFSSFYDLEVWEYIQRKTLRSLPKSF